MKRRGSSGKKERDYKVLFLILEKEKKVHMEISFSKEPAAVLRKHWRGEIDETKDLFSRNNPRAKPVMWVWDIDRVPRKKATAYLKEWERFFLKEGYEIIGQTPAYDPGESIFRLDGIEKYRVTRMNVATLIRGKNCRIVKCENAGEKRLAASQKYTTEAADDLLRIRVKADVANVFRDLCEEESLTHGQGIAMLLSSYTGHNDLVVSDLRDRLQKAEKVINEKNRKIEKLQGELRSWKESLEYPQKYQTLCLQDQLLRELYERCPTLGLCSDLMIRRYSHGMGINIFPEGKEYTFVSQEGIMPLCVEHLQYSQTYPACCSSIATNSAGSLLHSLFHSESSGETGRSLQYGASHCNSGTSGSSGRKEGNVPD